jgi:hypothetical protein
MLRIIPAAESNEWFGSNLFQWDRFQTSERVRIIAGSATHTG